MQGGGWGGAGGPPGNYGPPGGGYAQPGAMVPTSQGHGAIQFDLGFAFILWMLYFTTPRLEIDQQMERRPWGRFRVDLPAGVYRVTVSFAYGLMSRAGEATLMQVQVAPGCVTQVTYRAPWLIFFSGTMWQIAPRPEGAMMMSGR